MSATVATTSSLVWRQLWQAAIVNGAKRPARRGWLDAARHPTRRDGAVLWALLLLPWVVALILVRRHHHLDSGAYGVVTAFCVGLPVLWVAWAAYRDARRSGTPVSGLTITQVADRLAAAVRTQWENEAAVRRLNEPWPLPVPWVAADPSLTDAWDSLVRLATSGAGWHASSLPVTWASGPEDLAGTGGELVDVLAQVPTGRLVVLGRPGAGKTMLMVRLVLDLLARRDLGGPVPLLVSVASWDPSVQDLRGWLSARLVIDHPALAAPPPADVTESTQAAALVAARLILPVLDGLDEIPARLRGSAISRINDALRPGEQVVVTCRTRQYRDAVRPPDGLEVTLRGAAAIQLRPLDADVVRRYLGDDAPGSAARTRWDPVLAVLGTRAPAGQVLSTPLMVGLARAIYNPRPDEFAGTARDPAELCGFADRAAVEEHLFDQFIPAAYRAFAGGRWTAGQAGIWLTFLARHLEQTVGSPDLAWWQLQKAVPPTTRWLGPGLAAGLAAGTAAGLGAGLVGGLVTGLVAGLVAGFVTGLMVTHVAGQLARFMGRPDLPVRGVRINVAGVAYGSAVGLVVGLVGGLVAGPAVGLMGGLVLGLATVLSFGLEGVPPDLTEAVNPRLVLARDRQMTFVFTLGLWLAAGLVGGLAAGLVTGPAFRFGAGLLGGVAAGFVAGTAGGLGESMGRTKWMSYMLTRGWLATVHRLPWSLMSFLEDAHGRGVLRQVGAVYQFRHINLQRRLGERPATRVIRGNGTLLLVARRFAGHVQLGLWQKRRTALRRGLTPSSVCVC
jgi:hypothetical protein